MRYSHKPGKTSESDLPAPSANNFARELEVFEASVARLKASMSHQVELAEAQQAKHTTLRQEIEKFRLKVLALETSVHELREENLNLKRSLSEERKNSVQQSQSFEKTIAHLSQELKVAHVLLADALGGDAEPRHSLVVQRRDPSDTGRNAETVRPKASK